MRRIYMFMVIIFVISNWSFSKAFAQEIINDHLFLIGTKTKFDPTPVDGGACGTFTIMATFKNASKDNLSGLAFRAIQLTGGNLLLNADGGAGGVGSTLTVPFTGNENYFDGVLSPGENLKVNFIIGLASTNKFTFLVDALGAVVYNCGLPGPDQVIIYRERNRGGDCAMLEVGNYPNASAFGLPNDSISAIDVGFKVRAILYQHSHFNGNQAHYEGGFNYGQIGNVDNRTSSIEILPMQGGPAATHYLGNFPSDRENFWSNNAQGLANDGANWFVTTKSMIFKVPLSVSLNRGSSSGLVQTGIPIGLKNVGYDHFGDPDQHEGYLFVPIEHPSSGSKPCIAVFNTVDLRFFSSFELSDSPDRGAPWLAIRPGEGTLCVSSFNLSESNQLREYDIDWNRLATDGQLVLTFRRQITFLDRDCIIMPLKSLQGGVFNQEGTLLYTSSNGLSGSNGYVHVFAIENATDTALLQARSENKYGPFNFETHNGSTGDEAEGIDWLDVRGLNVPGIQDGQIHLVMVNVDIGTDDLYLKHYGGY